MTSLPDLAGLPDLADLAAEDGVRLAVRATGLLAAFTTRGVLAPADVAVARRLGRLGGEPDEQVLLAAALTVRALRSGSVCLELADVDRRVLGEDDALVPTDDLPWPAPPAAWEAAIAASPLTAPGGPLRLDDGLLWLDRYRRQEDQVRADLTARAVAAPPSVDHGRLRAALDRLFGDVAADDRQCLACAVATLRWTAVVAGGPGTGKTTTVARLLAVLRDQDPELRIALAAPTGKAAARLGEAIGEERLPGPDRARVGTPEASTIHRLLGPRPDTSSRFRHDRHRRLPHDVVVVDETSMVSLTLMARLLEAVRDDAHVVFVGDPDQLASVEAGAVLGDLVSAPDLAGPSARSETLDAALETAGCTGRAGPNGVVRLDRNYRNNADIAALAASIRAGDADAALELLRGARSLEFVEYADAAALAEREPAGLEGLREEIVGGAREVATAARAGDAAIALEQAEEHRLLCAHRRGPYGVSRWAAQVERWLDRADEDDDVLVDPDRAAGAQWWPGRPLLVTANDYDLGLYNGDTGVVVALPTADGGRRAVAVFSRGGTPLQRSPALLSGVQTVHAMTVHRAQGSQYARVSVLLPPAESPLLTRELLYTAVTRARTRVRVVGSADAVRAAVERPISRASGFARRTE